MQKYNFLLCIVVFFNDICILKHKDIHKDMRKVIGIGETVYDIIFKEGKPTEAVPGGSVFNSLMSLARSGVNTMFISEIGGDRIGDNILDFLHDNNVDASCVTRHRERKSDVSLAFLNEVNDAEYIFYKDHENASPEFEYPNINPDDIVLFGSYYAINPRIRQIVADFLDYAKKSGAILYYDVNYRASHKREIMKITPSLLENYDSADIVRGSSEDFLILYNSSEVDKIYNKEIAFYCKNFIYTQGVKGVELRAGADFAQHFDVTPMKTISTIGAGDNFNAGLVYGMLKHNITKAQLQQGLTKEQWKLLVDSAMMFSAECCKDIHNYISKEFGEKLKHT